MPVAFACFLISAIYGGGFWRVFALEGMFMEREELWDPVITLCRGELLEGGDGVLGVSDGKVVEV